ncbi:ribosome recycling factor domain-containing protein [Kockovaella imperatae]|uniref:Ribosome recycling factor domain-containing protein n=1 Tax=Kockovaella imperatae TaxID=4999 RepID=A0A1Y1U6T7_9TREE|nr:ribosome recycling factor domain-containing protein [Kockovaella imperatae]ORX33728.1 ribosome recycling factor domain-containing protein [Kockovaella imperatae]
MAHSLLRGTMNLSRNAVAGPSRLARLPPLRSFSSTPPSFKKSKAAAVKKAHKEAKNQVASEIEENPEGHRYEAAPVDDLETVLSKAKERMQKATDWAKAQVYEGVERVSGKLSPSLLDNVRVTTSESEGSHHLNTVASVTVRQGALWVDVWDSTSMKGVESAIKAANLPGVSPLRMSETSLKIPVSRPTHEQRQEILRQLAQIIETAKNQVRKARSDGINNLGGRKEPGADDVEKLANDFGGQLTDSLNAAKKAFEKV